MLFAWTRSHFEEVKTSTLSPAAYKAQVEPLVDNIMCLLGSTKAVRDVGVNAGLDCCRSHATTSSHLPCLFPSLAWRSPIIRSGSGTISLWAEDLTIQCAVGVLIYVFMAQVFHDIAL